MVEYFAAGCPVVTTDVGGVTEMVRNEYNALLIPCNDDEKLLNGLIRLIESPPLRSRLEKNALKTIVNGFSEKIMLDQLERFYKRHTNNSRI